MASVTMSTIAIVVAIAAFIFLSMKVVGPLITAVLAAAFVSLFTEAGFVQSFFTDFLSGVTSMVGNMFFLLVLGAIFGGVLSATGASEKIGTTFVRVMGPTNFLYALIAATMLLAATGAVPYVLMAYISFGVMRAANLPRYIAMAAVSGTMVLSQNVLPGCTTLNNLICSAPLGVDLYSAPLIGIATGVFAVLLNVFFLLYLVKDARKKGIGYEPMPNEGSIQLREEDDLPSFWASFFPVIFLIAFCFVLIVGFKVNATQAVVYSTVLSTILLYLLCRKTYRGPGVWKSVQSSAEFIIPNVMAASCVFGFASVVSKTTAFGALSASFANSSLNPYVLVVVAVMLLAGITASGLSGQNAFNAVLGQTMMDAGVNMQVVHRLGSIAASTFDSMPYSSYISLVLPVFGYDHKSGYKYLVVANIIIPVIYTLFALAIALIFY